MIGRIAILVSTLTAVTALSVPGLRQTQDAYGSLEGVLIDHHGGAIPGAAVTVNFGEGQPTATKVTNASGVYQIPRLAPGTASVHFFVPGFIELICAVRIERGQRTMLGGILEVRGGHDETSPRPPRSTPCLGAGEVAVSALVDGLGDRLMLVVDTAHAPTTANAFLKAVAARAYNKATLRVVVPPPVQVSSGRTPRDATAPSRFAEVTAAGLVTLPPAPPSQFESTTTSGLTHVAGTISIRPGASASSGAPSFIILLGDDASFNAGGRRFADARGASAFGRVVSGLDALRQLGNGPATIVQMEVIPGWPLR